MPARTSERSNKGQNRFLGADLDSDTQKTLFEEVVMDRVIDRVPIPLQTSSARKAALSQHLQDMAAKTQTFKDLESLEERIMRQTQAAIAASTKELLAQLLPAMQVQAQDMEGQARALVELRREKEVLETTAAKAAESKQAEELAALSAFLPVREVASATADGRLRGGSQRLDHRVAEAHRLLVDQGAITETELLRLDGALRLGQQVLPSSSSISSAPLGGVRGAGQRVVGLFGQLQEAGLVGVEGGAGPILALRRLMAKEVEKEVKAAATPSSYADFVSGWRKMGKMTRETLESDPDSFWVMTWHHQSMECVYLKHGWPAAAEYHKLVIGLWEQDFLDAQAHVDSSEFRRGNILMSTHMDSYHMAVVAKGGGGMKSGGQGSSGTPRALPNGGTKAKVKADDTYCGEHLCWFPKAADHSWSWSTKVGTCSLAKSKNK
jgi:hypothetical protein